MARSLRTALVASYLDAVEIDAAVGTIPGTGAGNGIEWVNNGRQVAVVLNTAGTALTVTEVVTPTLAGAAVTNPSKTVALTTGISILGPYPPGTFNDPASGKMALDFSATTGKVVLVEVQPTA